MIDWIFWIDEWNFPNSRIKSAASFYGSGNAIPEDIENPQTTPISISMYENLGDTNWALSPEWIESHPPDRGEQENDRERPPQEEEVRRDPYGEPEPEREPEYPFQDFNYGP